MKPFFSKILVSLLVGTSAITAGAAVLTIANRHTQDPAFLATSATSGKIPTTSNVTTSMTTEAPPQTETQRSATSGGTSTPSLSQSSSSPHYTVSHHNEEHEGVEGLFKKVFGDDE